MAAVRFSSSSETNIAKLLEDKDAENAKRKPHIGSEVNLRKERYELKKLTSLPTCGFIARLVEHRTGIAEVTGSNPVEAMIFFMLLLSNCLIGKFTAMITLHV